MSEQYPQFHPSVLKFRKPLLIVSWAIVIFFSILVPYFGVVKLDHIDGIPMLPLWQFTSETYTRLRWLCILSPVLIIPIGFGVHKLINWIFVYKNFVKLVDLYNKY